MSLPEHESQLSKQQKTGFVLLLFFAIITVALGFLQLRNTIYSPFAKKFTQKENEIVLQDEITRLQSIDTDRDGLSDYDEITFYQTSAYLPDTDSDGRTDKQEIDAKTNPLCAEGQVCDQEPLPASESAEEDLIEKALDVKTPLSLTGDQAVNGTAAMQPPATMTDVTALLSDPAQLRKHLIATGKITEAQLSQIDDATLIQTFTNTYQQVSASTAASSTITSSP